MFPFGMQDILGIICTPERNILEYYAWGCNKVGKLISCDTGRHQRENCGVEYMQRCLPNITGWVEVWACPYGLCLVAFF